MTTLRRASSAEEEPRSPTEAEAQIPHESRRSQPWARLHEPVPALRAAAAVHARCLKIGCRCNRVAALAASAARCASLSCPSPNLHSRRQRRHRNFPDVRPDSSNPPNRSRSARQARHLASADRLRCPVILVPDVRVCDLGDPDHSIVDLCLLRLRRLPVEEPTHPENHQKVPLR